MTYFVYVYYDQEQPFYVGMGSGRRHLDHIKHAKRAIADSTPKNQLSHKLNKIIKMLSEGRDPTIKIEFDGLSLEDAKKKETDLIRLYGRHDLGLGPLTNLTDGGEGVHGRTTMVSTSGERVSILKEERMLYEQMGYVHFNRGRKHSDEVNKKKAAPWAGKTRPEHGAKVKAAVARGAFKNRKSRGPHSENTKEKLRSPKRKKDGYQNRKWYHSPSLGQEKCICTIPDWPDVMLGRLPYRNQLFNK